MVAGTVAVAGPGAVQAGLMGAEVQLRLRDNVGSRRGMSGHVGLGVARGAAPSGAARMPHWMDLGVGVQHDHRWLRYRAAWSVGSLHLPATPSDSGWVVVTTGPRLSGGWVLEEQWALTVEGRAQATWMDPKRTFQPELLPWLVVLLGVESSF